MRATVRLQSATQDRIWGLMTYLAEKFELDKNRKLSITHFFTKIRKMEKKKKARQKQNSSGQKWSVPSLPTHGDSKRHSEQKEQQATGVCRSLVYSSGSHGRAHP